MSNAIALGQVTSQKARVQSSLASVSLNNVGILPPTSLYPSDGERSKDAVKNNNPDEKDTFSCTLFLCTCSRPFSLALDNILGAITITENPREFYYYSAGFRFIINPSNHYSQQPPMRGKVWRTEGALSLQRPTMLCYIYLAERTSEPFSLFVLPQRTPLLPPLHAPDVS